jgi:hypothetical protein
MAVLQWGTTLVATSLALHWVIWRIRVPVHQTSTLLRIFFGVLSCGLCLAFVTGSADSQIPWPLIEHPSGYLQVGLFVSSLALGYVITYSAIEADSPTLVIVDRIARAGNDGLHRNDLAIQLGDEVLIEPRVADLIRDGLVQSDDGHRLCLTSSGRHFISIFSIYRRILRQGKGG